METCPSQPGIWQQVCSSITRTANCITDLSFFIYCLTGCPRTAFAFPELLPSSQLHCHPQAPFSHSTRVLSSEIRGTDLLEQYHWADYYLLVKRISVNSWLEGTGVPHTLSHTLQLAISISTTVKPAKVTSFSVLLQRRVKGWVRCIWTASSF